MVLNERISKLTLDILPSSNKGDPDYHHNAFVVNGEASEEDPVRHALWLDNPPQGSTDTEPRKPSSIDGILATSRFCWWPQSPLEYPHVPKYHRIQLNALMLVSSEEHMRAHP